MAVGLVRVAGAIVMLIASAIVAEAAQQHAPLTDQQLKAQVEHRLLDLESMHTPIEVCHVRC
jgi:hypothetical protein